MKNNQKNQKGFAVFEVLFFVLLIIVLVAAAYYVGNHNNHNKTNIQNTVNTQTSTTKTSTSSATDSSQVVKQVQDAYTVFLKDVSAGNTSTSNFAQTSGYYTTNFAPIPASADPQLCDQNIAPESVTVANPNVNGTSASVDVTKVTPDSTNWPSFTVNLTKTSNKWLISGIDCTSYLKMAASIPQYQ